MAEVNALRKHLEDLLQHAWDSAFKSVEERTTWYMKSYPVFVEYFASSFDNLTEPEQIVRSSLVSAWVAKILKPDFGSTAIATYKSAVGCGIGRKISDIITTQVSRYRIENIL